MAAFDAPDGPLKGSGKLAVHVLICTIRPRASRSADRKAFITEMAPNTLTSNSRFTAASGNTSSGPGVRIPALLMRRSRPAAPTASDTPRAQLWTLFSSVMSQMLNATLPPEAPVTAADLCFVVPINQFVCFKLADSRRITSLPITQLTHIENSPGAESRPILCFLARSYFWYELPLSDGTPSSALFRGRGRPRFLQSCGRDSTPHPAGAKPTGEGS